jgi:hypothetical protein
VFWVICLLNVAAVISGYFQYELHDKLNDGEIVTENALLSNDLRHGVIGILQSLFYILSIIFFLSWFRRAYGNMHRLKIKNLEHNETMAIWSFVIPIISLFRPYKIAKEIVVETKQKLKEFAADYKPQTKLSVLGFWWALFLITNYIARFAVNSSFEEETIAQLMTSTSAYMISDFVDIIAAIITILMIKQMFRDESMLFEKVKIHESNQLNSVQTAF